MLISISDPVFQTHVFTVLFLIALLATIRLKTNPGSLGIETTQELKGFAIVAILFAHIGYYLVADHRFLFPLSVLAGVGVDLFLFVSGFGLTASAISRELSVVQFYFRRLKKVYVPLWITLAGFFFLDFIVSGKTYGWEYVFHSFVGWFPHANLYTDINSPLWYLSLIIFYYLVFPIVFSKRYLPLSALGLYAITYCLTRWTPVPLQEMIWVYQVHLMAFPLGMFAAWFLRGKSRLSEIKNIYLNYAILGVLMTLIGYFAIHSGVGKQHWIAEGVSMFTVFLILIAFIIKKFEVRLLYLFGLFSFEIYLVHWPILYRYDLFFRFMPGWLALSLYLCFFLGIGWIVQRLVQKMMSGE